MPKKRDLTGEVFGRLKAREPGSGKGSHTRWICDCECGESVEVQTADLLHSKKTSCGCASEQDRTIRTCICCEREFYSPKKRREFCFDCCPDGLTPNQNWRVKQRAVKHQLLLYKGVSACERCGCDVRECVLQFHHKNPEEKDFEFRDFNLNRTTHTMSILKQEADKCIVVCANCHCEIHEEIQDEISLREIEAHERKKAKYAYQQLVAPKNFDTKSVVEKSCKICGQKFISNNVGRTMCYECSPEGLSSNSARRARDKAVKRFLVQYKGGCCEKCGYSESFNALQFHHRNPDEKDFNISDMRHSDASFSMPILLGEVDKCLLLCANCHCLEHYVYEDATDIEFLNKSEYEEPIPIPDLQKDSEERAKKEQAKSKRVVKNLQENHCIECGAILKSMRSHICQKCSHDNQRRVKARPGKIQLSKMIIEDGFEAVGRRYGVSGKAIAKWLNTYKLPTRKKELEAWFYSFTGMAIGELK